MTPIPKPCPFCLDDYAKVMRRDTFFGSIDYYHVICQECRARGPEKRTIDDAVASWNDRQETER
jgi:Lar family restriction alleviation protein